MTSLGMGWLPQLPDIRDLNTDHPDIQPLLPKTMGVLAATLASRVDLRQWCSSIEDQGALGSCTAHAAVGVVELMEKKAFGKYVNASRLFVYKVIRNLMGVTGDAGGYLRTAMKALALVGAPPEANYPYVEKKFDEEPGAFVYSLAANYKALKYFQLDPPGKNGNDILNVVRQTLAGGIPVMFGFTVYSSIDNVGSNGYIPYPGKGETVVGGHAVAVVGYDNGIQIGPYKGALLIRNSWGPTWGDHGYGWLPYQYILGGLATDFWAIQSQAWVDTGAFG
jgi:C1A family cysteine protease